ncbi:hypothetical protein [Mesorhizobium sp. WSM3626]|uniref:hypothetical protein n=1 Tax=Mesorhizobium sp. WSM3626 TaxID=1040987 RepID=UPI0012EC5CB3|nr:hypothetical protein [Mesorhizobium sp. WSM3626]
MAQLSVASLYSSTEIRGLSQAASAAEAHGQALYARRLDANPPIDRLTASGTILGNGHLVEDDFSQQPLSASKFMEQVSQNRSPSRSAASSLTPKRQLICSNTEVRIEAMVCDFSGERRAAQAASRSKSPSLIFQPLIGTLRSRRDFAFCIKHV